MQNMGKMNQGYQLRYAAGQYWLLHMEQEGIPYECPISLNFIGAEIWKKMRDGQDFEQIVSELAAEYEVSEKEIRQDVEGFYDRLSAYGIWTKEA